NPDIGFNFQADPDLSQMGSRLSSLLDSGRLTDPNAMQQRAERMGARVEAGPGNAFSRSQLQGLTAQARGALNQSNRQQMAGAGQAASARGTGGPDLAGMLGAQMDA